MGRLEMSPAAQAFADASIPAACSDFESSIGHPVGVALLLTSRHPAIGTRGGAVQPKRCTPTSCSALMPRLRCF